MSGGYAIEDWDDGPDGTFLLVKGDPAARTQLRVVFNWFEEVRTHLRADQSLA